MLGEDAFPSWAEPAWKRNVRRFFSKIGGGIFVGFSIILLPAGLMLAAWLFNIALDLHMTFGEHVQMTIGLAILSVIIGAIADK